VLDDTLLVVTSDHGEEFLEHGFVEHAWTLYEESLRVPLVVWAPGARPGRVAGRVSLVDLYPTILDLSGLPWDPAALAGRSLIRRAKDGVAFEVTARALVAELLIHDRNLLRSISDDRFKYVATWRWLAPEERPAALVRTTAVPALDTWGPPVAEELYDLRDDPAERHDLADQRPLELARLRAEMERYLDSCDRRLSRRRPGAEAGGEEADALRALGYLGDPVEGGTEGGP
jgi:arylsulfatase A-like enzyme